MHASFTNPDRVTIVPEVPNQIVSAIEVDGLLGEVRDLNVTVDIRHTWTSDLEVYLVAPNGERVVLVSGRGANGDNFVDTTFDDAATTAIQGASPPFSGVFQPEENLARFDGIDPNGRWELHIDDSQFADGGALQSWTLDIETCCHDLVNSEPVYIYPGAPSTITSAIEVSGLPGSLVADIDVGVDIDHTWDRDLTIALNGPDGTRVILSNRRGGSRDDFRGTVFDDDADTAVADGNAPFAGSFRPDQALSAFQDKIAEGTWTLEITDNAEADGGWLNEWKLHITTKNASQPTDSAYQIDVRFLGGLTANQRAVFDLAAARWAEMIVGNLPSFEVEGDVIDDLLIEARGTAIDGRGNILGQAGPTYLRSDTSLPIKAIMSFDSADLDAMEADGSLVNVIIHEMAHCIGIGTIWSDLGLIDGAGTDNPTFLGDKAMAEYAGLAQHPDPTPVPVANTGGAGTRDGHWRETVFGNELMTGFLGTGIQSISRMTVAALEDMGYTVDYDAADPYNLPSSLRLAEVGLMAARADRGNVFFPDRVFVPMDKKVSD